MTSTQRPIALVLVIALVCCSIGCAKSKEQVWSTKQESINSSGTPARAAAHEPPVQPQQIEPVEPETLVGADLLSESSEPMLTPVEEPKLQPVDMRVQPVTTPSLASAPVSDSELSHRALQILLQATNSSTPQLRANAIEALHAAPQHIEPAVRHGLADENRGVRFVAAMTVGKLKMRETAPLLEPLLHDDSESVRAAAIYGLRRCGREVNPTPLASMLLSENPEVKGNAAFVLGELGDRSAVQLLEHAVGRGLTRVAPARVKIVELQLAEAMVKLGAENQIVPIRAALFAPAEESELVALACQMCGRMNDGKAAPDLNNLLMHTGPRQRSAEVRMAAAAALAQIQPQKLVPEIALEYVESQQPHLRAQAATTLGIIGQRESLSHLARLLDDPHPLVQSSAAGAILMIEKPSASVSAR